MLEILETTNKENQGCPLLIPNCDALKELSVAYRDPDFAILFFGFSWSYRFKPWVSH